MLFSLLLFADDQGGAPGFAPFIPIALMFLALWLVVILPAQRRDRRQREALMTGLKKNDKVLTQGGIIGVVAQIKDKEDEVTLKVDESSNTRLRVLKSSIIKIYGPEEVARDQGK
jgi:preprotein translocase subunit YajC